MRTTFPAHHERIDANARTPDFGGAVEDPDTGALISDAEVAETSYTLTVRGRGRVTARLVVRRVRRRQLPGLAVPGVAVSPVLHQLRPAHHRADLTHRKHVIVETTFADLIAGPLAHLPGCSPPTAPGWPAR